jgi:flagellar biogenesis protein FliO
MDTALLGLRVVLSLAVVLGLIWFAGRKLQGSAGMRKQRTVPLSVLIRQSLGKGAGVALVEVAGRVLLLGVGEQGVRVLTEVDVPPTPAPAERTGERREEIDLATLPILPVGETAGQIVADDAEAGVRAPIEVPVDASAEAEVADAEITDAVATSDADAADADDDLPTPHADGTARLAALAGLAAGAAGAATSAGATQAGAAGAAHPGAQECTASAGALTGSILSPDTWRRAAGVVQRRAAG